MNISATGSNLISVRDKSNNRSAGLNSSLADKSTTGSFSVPSLLFNPEGAQVLQQQAQCFPGGKEGAGVTSLPSLPGLCGCLENTQMLRRVLTQQHICLRPPWQVVVATPGEAQMLSAAGWRSSQQIFPP